MATLPKSAAQALYPKLPSSAAAPTSAGRAQSGNAASRMYPNLPSESRRAAFVMVPVYVPPKRIRR